MMNLTPNYIEKVCKANGGALELPGCVVLLEVEKVHDGFSDSRQETFQFSLAFLHLSLPHMNLF